MTQLYTRREAADILRVGRSTLDSHISGGRIRVVRLGRRVLVPSSEIERLSQAS